MCSVSARAAGVHTRTHTYTVSGDDGRGALLSSVSPLPLSFPWASPRILSLDVVSPPTRISRCISSASRIISDRPRSPLTRRRSRRTSPRDPVLTHVYTHIHTCTGTHRSPYEAPTTVAVADAEGTPDSRRAGYTPRSNATAGSRTRAGHRRRYLHRGCSDLASAAFPRRPRRVDTDESFPFLPHCAPPLSVLPVPPFVRTLHARHRRLTAHTPGIPARLCVRARVCVCVCVCIRRFRRENTNATDTRRDATQRDTTATRQRDTNCGWIPRDVFPRSFRSTGKPPRSRRPFRTPLRTRAHPQTTHMRKRDTAHPRYRVSVARRAHLRRHDHSLYLLLAHHLSLLGRARSFSLSLLYALRSPSRSHARVARATIFLSLPLPLFLARSSSTRRTDRPTDRPTDQPPL